MSGAYRVEVLPPEVAADRRVEATLEAERAVLGGLLVDPSRLDDVGEILTAGDYYRDAHRLIWAAMQRVAADGAVLDPLTVRAALGLELERAGGLGYLFALTDGVPKAAHVAHYARIVRDYAMRRELEALGRELQLRAGGTDDPAAEVLEYAEAGLLRLRTSQPGTDVTGPMERAGAALSAVEAAGEGRRRGILSGLRELDELTFGFRPGQLIVLGARPSQGKTALALNLAVAAGASGPVLFASLEMSTEQISARELALRSQIPHAALDAGRVPDRLAATLSAASQAIYDGGIHVLDRPGASVSQIRGAARRLAASTRRTPALVVVDYLQLMRPDRGQKSENRTLEVAQFSAGLKQLARELEVPVLALSQLSRESERRTDKRPLLADLRESGALEQDADVVLLLHRPGVYDRNPDDRRAELIVAKQRNGPTGVASLSFEAETMRFADVTSLSERLAASW